MLHLLTLLAVFLLPMTAAAQSSSELDFDEMTVYDLDGPSASSIDIGAMEFYRFSNGQSVTHQQFGNMELYSSPSPGLSGKVQQFGPMGFGSWNDGTTSTRQRFGIMQFDTYQRGNQSLTCTSQRFGNQTFTSCQ